MTYDQLRTAVKNKGYTFFDNSVNLIGVRTDDVFDNQFSDFLHVAYTDYATNQKKVLTLPWTTLAGTLGKGGVYKPLTVGGTNVKTNKWEVVTGVAVLVEGQYRGAYKFIDDYVTWLSYPFFNQVGDVLVYRDGTINDIIDRGGSVIHKGKFGVNIHRMSNNGTVSKFVNFAESQYAPNGVTWSQGCQGSPEPEFKKLLPIVRQDVKRNGNIFSYTLLHQRDC